MKSGIFPDKLKTAVKKTSMLKRGEGNTQNYRAIPLLSVFAKILEVFVNNRLTASITKSNIVKRHNVFSDSENQLNQ